MAKKTKRNNRREMSPVNEKPMADTLIGNRPSGFNPDYHIVISDIRRVGVLAGSFIIILVILAFFLH